MPCENDGNITSTDLDLINTTTEITYVSASTFKEGHFTTTGYVKDINQIGVANMSVEIYITPEKEVKGLITGREKTDENGFFSINCVVPPDAVVGENHVIAWARRNEVYEASYTDPIIEIFSNTTLRLTMVESVGLNSTPEIRGILVDASNMPISGKPIATYWEDEYRGECITDDNGMFLTIAYSTTNLGTFNVYALFRGDEYFGSSEDNKTITVKDFSTSLELTVTPTTVKREDTLTLQGKLSSSSDLMPNAPIQIFYDIEQTISTTTSSQGEFEESFQIPKNSTLGNIIIRAHYPGTESYAEANAEQIVLVQSETQLVLTSPSKEMIKINETITIAGNITDDQAQPVSDLPIHLNWNVYTTNMTTDSNGSFNLTYIIPTNASLGTSSIIVEFLGNEKYLPSQDSMEVEIVPSNFTQGADKSQNNYILLAIAIGAVAAILVVIVVLFKKQKIKEVITIEEIATQTINSLKTEGDSRKTVIGCYKKMCDWMGNNGVKKGSYQTPREFAMASKGHLKMSPESLYSLTQIFEKARYSQHEISIEDKEKAIKCLSEIISANSENTAEAIPVALPREGNSQ